MADAPRAILKASNFRQTDEYCRLLARTGGGLILLQLLDGAGNDKGNPFSADRSRLRRLADRTRTVDDETIDALPWRGKGPDPRTPVDNSGPAAERAFFS